MKDMQLQMYNNLIKEMIRMKVSGRYLKYVRTKYSAQTTVNIMDIFKLRHFDVENDHDTFNCSVAGATSMPEDTKDIWVHVVYTLHKNLYAENITGQYSPSEDAVYINIDDFIPKSVWE
jgi:hypothetical protein